MSRLLKVELRRLFARRLTLIGAAATLLIAGLLLLAAWQDSKPLSAEEERQQRVQFEAAQKDWQVNGTRMLEECRAGEAQARTSDPNADFACDQMEPRWESWGKPETVFGEAMPDFLHGLAYLMVFAVFLIAAGFIGAEFSTGSIGNWLTFEPRRLRVYASKVLAAATGPLPGAALLMVLFTAACWLVIRQNGTTAGTTSGTWADLGGTAGRTVVRVAAAGAMGVVIGSLLRHTAAAIGVAMAYLVIVEGIFAYSLNKLQPWLLRANIDGWIKHGTTYYVEDCVTGPDGSYRCDSAERVLSFGHSAAYLGVLVAVLVVVGAVVFRRRDIT